MPHNKMQARRLFSIACVTSVFLIPFTATALEPANAAEEQLHDAAYENIEDLAVTEKNLEEVRIPMGYISDDQVIQEEVEAAETQIQGIEAAPEVTEQTEESSLARALISSPTAVVGVSFPQVGLIEKVEVAYRSRTGEVWTAWQNLELAETEVQLESTQSVIPGTDPIFLIDADEVEVAAHTVDGQSIPGVQLTVIEPELSAVELPAEQLRAHGEDALEAVKSLTDDKYSSLTEEPNREEEYPLKSEREDGQKEFRPEDNATPTEESESRAQIEVPLSVGMPGAQVLSGGSRMLRAQGISPDGKSYITNLPGLTITTRKGWEANEKWMDWDPEKTTFKGAVIHHTAGSNNYTKEQVPGVIQGIYRYHALTLGWGDIGYHLIVDKFGGVWEGRAGGLTSMTEGGHAYGANSTTFGVSLLGDYGSTKPSDEALDAIAKATAWKLNFHGIKNLDATFTTKGNQYGKSSVTLPIVSPHRQVGGTTCPGDAFMTRWNELIAKVKTYTDQLQKKPASETTAKVQNLTSQGWMPTRIIGHGWRAGKTYAAGAFFGPGHTDAMIIDDQGRMWLYPGKDHGNFYTSRRHIGNGWNILDQITAGYDFDGDSYPDVVGRMKSNGEFRLYPGNGHGGFKPMRPIGYGWGVFDSIYVVPNIVNGAPVVYAVEAKTGHLRAYLTNGRGAFTTRVDIPEDWSQMRDLNSMGDQDKDGKKDFAAIDARGQMWLYFGDNRGSYTRRMQIGRGWNSLNPVVGSGSPGNFWAVNPQGTLLRYTFKGLS